ncbi:peptidoglycan recognition protein family protein [Pectinatus cerevisiiphilus]|uniref:N-acetylmuramoyl-L-alanine amidase n=1 Tax=Pectinatus cerevisiiphilus TaxID=86956 RepID=A0A4R3K8P9_9FIRM|nr:peptidoglycan recognition family protein [Pectinatus cerevisiiphilus]TCS79300.1 N-acetylmuramoyl-L-alanine amidase [Pectinatus cerevisiiphilus]
MINRRKFLLYALGTMGSVLLSPKNTFMKIAQAASVGRPLLSPSVKETYLNFVMPLENRQQTDMIIIHHVGGTNRDVSAAEIHQWHLANGWAGIGYHYVIRKDGTIERGRPRDVIGAHCYGYNKTSIGINLVGNFEEAYPTEAQLASGEQLTAYLCQLYRLNATDNIIFGHRDLNDTLCPGENLYNQLEDFKQAVFAKL